MKVGCFGKFLVLFIFLAAISYYVFDKYKVEIFEKSSENLREIVSEEIVGSLENYFDEDLSIEIENKIHNLVNEISLEDVKTIYDKKDIIIEKIKFYLEDSKLTSLELNKIEDFIDEQKQKD